MSYYNLYMQSYMEDALEEMKECLGENSQQYLEAKDKSEVYKINYYLRDHLQIPYVSETLAKRRTRDQLIAFVAKFLDDHSRELSTSGPVYMFTFGNNETSFLYDMFGVNGDQLIEMYLAMVEETFYGNISKFFTGWVKMLHIKFY